VETVADFIFGGSKITADGDCSHEIKRLHMHRDLTELIKKVCKMAGYTKINCIPMH